jgi:hypothetical protein
MIRNDNYKQNIKIVKQKYYKFNSNNNNNTKEKIF